MEKRKRPVTALVILFAVNLCLIVYAQSTFTAADRHRSEGSIVSHLQNTLIDRGYIKGDDRVYRMETETAAESSTGQNDNSTDGNADSAVQNALEFTGSTVGEAHYTADVSLLARLISSEAQNEPFNGQVAVGAVILNRTEHSSFPDTLSGVIYQNGAFSSVVDGQFDQPIAESAYRAAREALNGADPSGGAIYFFNPVETNSAYLWSRPLIAVIGKYRFCG